MKPHKVIILFFFCFHAISVDGQKSIQFVNSVNLPSYLSSANKPYEFSSLVNWNNKFILLVPSFKNVTTDTIYALPYNEVVRNSLKPESIKKIIFDVKSFNKFIIDSNGNCSPVYDGIEASVVVGSSIFFSVERSQKPYCYSSYCNIIKGKIDTSNKNWQIIFDASIKIKKPSHSQGNEGFESLAYIESTKNIITIFETNNFDTNNIDTLKKENKKCIAYEMNLALQNVKQMKFPIFKNRLTDMFYLNKSTIVGINSLFEKNNNCIYNIVTYNLVSNSVKVLDSFKLEENECKYNWEGIAKFEDGFLMINDNCYCDSAAKKGQDPSALHYYKFIR